MDKVYQLFDKFTNMIPSNMLQMIRLGALLLWLILATIATVTSWQSGAESAPAKGQELSLSNIKENIARKKNINKIGDIVLPDLNDLIREKRKKVQEDIPSQTRPTENPLIKPNSNPIETQNPIRSFNKKEASVPVYQTEQTHTLLEQKKFVPKNDQGSGGVIQNKKKPMHTIQKNTQAKKTFPSSKIDLPYYTD